MHRAAILLAACLCASAQAPLQNNGKPILLPFECSADDVEASGLSCPQEEPCPVYLELSGLETVGNKIFVSGNIHTPEATLYSLLLASSDGGATWNEPTPRLRATSLDEIQFVDYEHGFISGQALRPLPHDPFFLVSNDGGVTWKQRPIYDEEHAGSVIQFHFESLENGHLLVDTGSGVRHELYETMTGGSTWTLRHASAAPIPFPGAPSRDAADWRLRADATAHAYQIERRQEGHWRAAAAFLIDLGACRQ